jgi:hypothetical protein
LAASIPWINGYFRPPMNGDVAAILMFAVRMVAGDRLYVDLIDVNPPLIFLINVIPAALSAWLGIQPATMFIAFVLVLVAASVAVTAFLLRRTLPVSNPLGPWLLMFTLAILPAGNLGEREHLMVTLALPWFALGLARLRRLEIGRGAAIAIALVAGAGFLIKPYFLATPALVECYLLSQLGWRAWRRRPELWAMPALAALYAASLPLCFPEYLDTVAPTAARYYAQTHLGAALDHVFGQGERWIALVGLLLLLAAARRQAEVALPCCLIAGGLISALLQGKGWDYHMAPAWSGLALGAGGLALRSSAFLRPGFACLGAAAATLSFAILHPPFAVSAGYQESAEARLARLVRAYAHDQPVLWLTEGVWPEYPAILYAEARPDMANMELWLLGSLYRAKPTAWTPIGEMGADEDRLFQSVVRSFIDTLPPLVVVEPKPIDFIGYFSRDTAFAQAWSDYHEVDRVGAIRLFARTPATASAP